MLRMIAPLVSAMLISAATPDEIRSILVDRVDVSRKAVGMVVATVGPEGRQFVAHGRTSHDGPPVDGNTIFEIGSVTKVFTALLLADMVERGEVRLDTPVAQLLGPDAVVPSRNGRQITLQDLAMHVSGLPRLPSNFAPADSANPYADYNATRLQEFLTTHVLQRDPGEKYEYSNLGAGLLGHALARKAGMRYEELLRRRVFQPLGMTSTAITLSPEHRRRVATPHNPGRTAVPAWDFDALAGAGAIRSTASDLLTFLEAAMGVRRTPLAPAFRRLRSVQRPTGDGFTDIELGWHVWKRDGVEVVWHNGGTYGFRSFMGFDPARKFAGVVLCNTMFDNDDLGRYLFNDRWSVQRFGPPRQRIAVAVDPKLLAEYAGEYRFTPQFSMRIISEEGKLYVQPTGEPRHEAFAESPTAFFLKVADAQFTFVRDASGKITKLVWRQGGESEAARVE